MAVVDRFTKAGPRLRSGSGTPLERFHEPPAGGAGGTVDTTARTAAGSAQSSVDAITPQASEIIPTGGVVYTSEGVFENATAGPVTLSATNPPTAASLQADGLTPQATADPNQPTNWAIPASAFADAENPALAEVTTHLTNNVPTSTPGDSLTYQSAGGKRYAWSVGDAEGGTAQVALTSFYDPSESGGHVAIRLNAVANIEPDANTRVLRSYTLAAETPVTQPDAGQATRDGVAYTLAASTGIDDAIVVNRVSAQEVYFAGAQVSINGVADNLWINERNQSIKLSGDGAGGWTLGR